MKASSLVIEMSPTKDLPEEEEVMVAEAEDIRINKIIIMTAFNLKAGKIIINNDKGKINNNNLKSKEIILNQQIFGNQKALTSF